MALEVAAERWIRRDGRCRIFAAFSCAWSLFWAVMGGWFWLAPSDAKLDIVGATIFSLFIVAMVVPGVWLTVRFVRAGLWLSANESVVRGPFSTTTVAIKDIAQFTTEVTDVAGTNGMPCVALQKADGDSIGIFALGRETLIWRIDRTLAEMEPLRDRINALLDELRRGEAETSTFVVETRRATSATGSSGGDFTSW